MSKLKTLKEIELQVCRREKTKDGLSEECFCEEDLKKEIRLVAREWIKECGKPYDEHGWFSQKWKNRFKEADPIIRWIKHFFNLEEE